MTAEEPLGRNPRVALGAVVASAFALRVAYVLGQRHDILFDHPAMDEARYVEMAREVAAGRPAEKGAWFQPPGLVYALSIIFRVAGPGLLAPRLVQAVVSSAACLLAFAIARRWFGVRIALATAAICAVHGVMIFETYELLPPTWAMTADLVAIWALLRAGDSQEPTEAFGAGAALGLSAVFTPIVLPFAAIAAAWLRRWPLVLAFAAGAALVIAPVTAGNWKRGHELVAISTNGGINFYIGNNPDYDATLALRPGRRWLQLLDEPNAQAAGGPKSPGERSAWFADKGLAFYRTQPAHAIGLYLRKLYLYFNGVELPRDSDVYAERGSSRLLSVLVTRGPPALPEGILVPLAIVGAVAAWRERGRELLVPIGFVALQATAVAAFFVTSRYRMPALPVFAMFACVGASFAWRSLRTSRFAPVAAVVALAVVFALPVREAKASFAAERDFYRGLAFLRQRHDPAAAVEPLRRATALDPSDARTWFELGNALSAAGRADEAIPAWMRAAALDRSDPRATRAAADALVARGDLDGAIAAIESALAAGGRDEASFASDRMSLAMLLARRGEHARALEQLGMVAQKNGPYFRGSIVSWTRAALTTPRLGDAAFWIAMGDRLRDIQRPIAREAWLRARASTPSAAEAETIEARLAL